LVKKKIMPPNPSLSHKVTVQLYKGPPPTSVFLILLLDFFASFRRVDAVAWLWVFYATSRPENRVYFRKSPKLNGALPVSALFVEAAVHPARAPLDVSSS
jgi:hypothetical protein